MRQVKNPPNPYLKYSAEYIGEPPKAKLEVFEETHTKSMISKSWTPDLGSRFIVNCYRGCIHACTYCFARQYHEYLGYGAGTDFETKIVAKVNAPKVLRNELKKTKQKIPYLEFSFATDPYLPLEANYQLTQKCLEVCYEFRMPVAVITKSPLITRDLELLKKLKATIFFSIPFLTTEKSNPFEPYTPIPDARFRAMKKLSDAGIKTGLALAPLIPSYNDSDIPLLLEKARKSGATKAFMSLIHIDSPSIEEYFVQKIEEKIPSKKSKILNQIKREKSGTLQHQNFNERNKGKTQQWEMAKDLFDLHFKRLGFESFSREEKKVKRKSLPVQQKLF